MKMTEAEVVTPDVLVATHGQAVERVITTMRDQIYAPLSLDDMASIAYLSPFYFNRVFRQAIGIPPGEFLAALRIDAARRLLMTTSMSVTEICFSVGYTSLGTFTTRFAQLVGLPPQHLRRFATRFDPAAFALLAQGQGDKPMYARAAHEIAGMLTAPAGFHGLICVGLFPKPLPQCRPVSCTLLTGSGVFHIPAVPDGRYHVMAAAMPAASSLHSFMVPDAHWNVGMSQRAVILSNGMQFGPADVVVRPPHPTDPPVLIALPYLLAQTFFTLPALTS